MPRRELVREIDVVLERLRIERLAAAASDDDVLLDGVHDREHGVEVQLRRDLLLERFEEELLPGVAIQVGVEVSEPHIGERIARIQPLIAREQVDLGNAGTVGRIAEISMVDVEPDPAEVVDEIVEAGEVDRDEIVDRKPREGPHQISFNR